MADLREKAKKKIRKIFKINKYQMIVRTLQQRWRIAWQKKLYRKTYTTQDIITALIQMGIGEGCHIMVHCSYEEFYRYEGDPVQLVEALIELVGETGTVLMPSYGSEKDSFDVRYSPSMAGILSEVFRRRDGVVRSASISFAVAGCGVIADEVTKEHMQSQYGFDEHSPYYKFSQIPGGRVVLFGLGKRSIYFSVLHCLDWMLKDELPYFKELMSVSHNGIVTDAEGNEHHVHMIGRREGNLSIRNIRKVYSKMPAGSWEHSKLSNLDIVVCDCAEALQTGEKLARQGNPIYKKPKPKKHLFIPLQQ